MQEPRARRRGRAERSSCSRRWRSSRPTRSTGSTRARRCPSARGPYGNTLPDRITLFQRPIEEDCEDEDEVRAVIGETLIHEVGHYFGLSEEEIEEIEERYWRGETLGPDERRAGTDGRTRVTRGARKRFGQHFLEPAWVAQAGRRASTPRRDETFLEIGPGRGALTAPLAPRVRHGRRRRNRSRPRRDARRATCPPNVRVVEADFLDVDLAAAAARRARSPFASSATCPTTSSRRSCSSCSHAATTGGCFATRR